MSVINVSKDSKAFTMTVTSEWEAPIADVWELWADPRKLERWWGPPTYPATVVEHDLRPGGRVRYRMTSPEGEQFPGWWTVVEVAEPRHLSLVDGFADADGTANETLPTTAFVVSLSELPSGATRMVIESTFPSLAAMEQLIEMGMEEGLQAAMSQIDSVLSN
jgi:uncharacterized protein YndB with AHSA1/START domain